MLIKYWARATASGLPLMVMVRSVLPPSRSSQFEMRIMAPEICRISAILVPPFPIMQPIKSFGTVISCCWVLVCVRLVVVRNCEPARAARATSRQRQGWRMGRKKWVSKKLLSVCLGDVKAIHTNVIPFLTKFGISYSYWYLFGSIHRYLRGLRLLILALQAQLMDSSLVRTSVKDSKRENMWCRKLNHHQDSCRSLNDHNKILKNSIWS